MSKGIIFDNCYTGTDFETLMVNVLNQFGLHAKTTGKNDNGIDIIAELTLDSFHQKYYIQCKYQNSTVGKAPIQEVFTGCAYYGNDGKPVVITNNRVTCEARIFAKQLGVEIMGDAEIQEIRKVYRTRQLDNPTLTGLTAYICGYIAGNEEYATKGLSESTEILELDNKEKLKLELVDGFDRAEEYTKEAARLEQQASNYKVKALQLQKEMMLKNLEYG